jgi:PAS domain S-box-containing protein
MDPERVTGPSDEALRSVDITSDLERRPARQPDHAAENRALVDLAERMATEPKDVVEKLVELALLLCHAQSSGISLAQEQDGEPVFRWQAAAGAFAPLAGAAMPRAQSPGRIVVERRRPMLLSRPERCFPALAAAQPPIVEALLVPFFVGGECTGALWVIAHDLEHRFDREDVRVLSSLARFASLALQTLSLSGAATRARRQSDETEAALRGSEQRFTKFMQHLPGLAWIKDLDGRYVFVNDAAERAFQKPRAQLLGRTDDEIFPPEVAAQFKGHDRRALEHEAGLETIETLEHEDGVHHSLVAKFPIPGRDGSPALVGGVAIDVTARMQAEEILRESEERFREMADNSPAIIYTTQPDGYCTFLSSAWTQMTGREIESGLGFGWGNLVHPEDLERTRAAFAPKPEPTPFRVEFRLAHPSGGHHWVIGSGAPRLGKNGEFLGFVGSVLDVDNEKRSEEALRNSISLYQAMGESIDYGVWVCDANGRNVYTSQSFLRLVGLTQAECSDFGWGRVLHPEDAERTFALWQECVRSGEHWDMEHRFRGVDGKWHPVLARGVRVRNERGETTAWAGINLDISRLKHVEDELREVDRRKDEFLATLAHELRNPLAPIRNSLHVLRLADNDRETMRVHEMIDRQVNHLIRLVEDLLEVARITSGKIELRRERIDLADVVRAAVETSRPAIERARHRLEVSLPDEPLVLEADSVRLAQVLANLLNNAAKYTEESGAIWLAARRQGRWATLSVRDTGVGIPPAMLPRVFDLFTQVDRTLGRSQGGLGIGLALVKRLVEMHGGSVEATSGGWGAGSEFTVRLPLAAPLAVPASVPMAPEESPASPTPRRRFLVVDDNRDAAESLALLLRLHGVDVEVAYDGASALETLRRQRCETVFLDLGMPGMDGFEVAARIRREPDLGGIVLVALTGWGQPEHRRQTTDAGFDHHLVKPVSLPELRSLLGLQLRKSL